MSPVHQIATGLALTACMLGLLLCRAVISSARRKGAYKSWQRIPTTVTEAQDPDQFLASLMFWDLSAQAFAWGGLIIIGI